MTRNEAEALKQYGVDVDIEVQLDCQGSVWCVSFRKDVVTTDFQYAFMMIQRYGRDRLHRIMERQAGEILMVA